MRATSRICDILQCDLPILSAGMGGVARAELVAAISRAGGYGALGMVREDTSFIAGQIERVRAQVPGMAFGVNLIPAATPRALLDEQIDCVITQQIHSVTLFWDVDPPAIDRLRRAGILVLHQVGSLDDAQHAERAGAQILIVQGREAGGHVRRNELLEDLLRSVLEHTALPVVAAGGIASPDRVAHMFDAGAEGVMIGSAFLACRESNAHTRHKKALVEAGGADTFLTTVFARNWPPESPVRILPNAACGPEGQLLRDDGSTIGFDGCRPIKRFSTDSPLRGMHGALDQMPLYAGQGIDNIRSITSIAERMADLADGVPMEWGDALRGLPETPQPASPVCYAEESDLNDAALGFAPREEIVEALEVLLEAERAGARVAALSSLSAPAAYQPLLRAVHRDERRFCAMLTGWIERLGRQPQDRIGAFFEKAMAIPDIEDRLAFLNRGQAWVSKRLRTLLPQIRDAALYEDLRDMLIAHDGNIERTSKALGGRSGEKETI